MASSTRVKPKADELAEVCVLYCLFFSSCEDTLEPLWRHMFEGHRFGLKQSSFLLFPPTPPQPHFPRNKYHCPPSTNNAAISTLRFQRLHICDSKMFLINHRAMSSLKYHYTLVTSHSLVVVVLCVASLIQILSYEGTAETTFAQKHTNTNWKVSLGAWSGWVMKKSTRAGFGGELLMSSTWPLKRYT